MRITDPRAIKALAHPLRLDLLELLAAISPATAARCGRELGQSQASCSFHLRQLAKYGFVEDAGPGADRRERLWRTTDRRFSLDDGLDPAVLREYHHVLALREAERVAEYFARRADEPAEWRSAALFSAATLAVTAAEAAELKQVWRDAIAPYVARAAGTLPPGQRHVHFYLATTPLPDTTFGDSDDE